MLLGRSDPAGDQDRQNGFLARPARPPGASRSKRKARRLSPCQMPPTRPAGPADSTNDRARCAPGSADGGRFCAGRTNGSESRHPAGVPQRVGASPIAMAIQGRCPSGGYGASLPATPASASMIEACRAASTEDDQHAGSQVSVSEDSQRRSAAPATSSHVFPTLSASAVRKRPSRACLAKAARSGVSVTP